MEGGKAGECVESTMVTVLGRFCLQLSTAPFVLPATYPLQPNSSAGS
jgi:hypothetical protein